MHTMGFNIYGGNVQQHYIWPCIVAVKYRFVPITDFLSFINELILALTYSRVQK